MASLPDQIWYLVFSLFEDCISVKTWRSSQRAKRHRPNVMALRSLCLVSHRFRDLAQPMLYRTLHLTSFGRGQYAYGLMIQSLVAHPQLGQVTGAISLHDISLKAQPLQMRMDAWCGRSLVDLLKEARTLLDLPPAVDGRLDAALSPILSGAGLDTLILALTPRVRLVDVTVPSTIPSDGSSPLPWILGGQEDEPVRHGLSKCCLPHLTEVWLRRDRYRPENFNMVELEPLLLHPTLKTLRVCNFECKEQHVSELKWPDRVSKLETLELRRCILDMTGMKSILTRCCNIRRLAIHLGPEPDLPVMIRPGSRMDDQSRNPVRNDMILETTFDLTVFGQILRELAKDLIELDLNTTRYRDYKQVEGEIGSLRELDSLRHLKLMPRDLGSRQASLNGSLPRLLESLVLYGYGPCDEDLAKPFTTDGHPNLRVTEE